ncbi:hypothetical protein EW146_g6226 [Bondarzewia mesenterica]|uniref:Uncharacterized protein n=1 Tax=Bondarzewia mesenterica TaxID=1095465 RepID=A0A4S4LPU2_9AGAM|nr:hypothetical protein EW146_g6226 [Bondarzewia mesenterica]
MSAVISGFRIGKAGSPFHHHKVKRANAACSTGGFYQSPSSGQSIEYTTPLNISWDISCLDTNAVDIYLYAPGATTSRIHVWENVYFPTGSYQTNLEPRWWNSSSSVHLQLTIVQRGMAPFLATLPAGPVFTATYTAPSSGQTPAVADVSKADSGVTVVSNMPSTSHGLSKGKVAAAVIIPLLVIIALIAAAYFKLSRARGKEKRKRWSEAVDKRMSTISTDWKSISAAGASAAIRNSMAIPGAGNRASSFSFGAIRPTSTVEIDGGQAGIGSRALRDGAAPPMSQLRPRISTAASGTRVSRVSFAADARPSMESRRTVTSRAFHNGFVPPLPERQDSDSSSSASDGVLSPTQTSGPLSLSVEDIQSRLNGDDVVPRPSVDEVMPALRMMQTGENTSSAEPDMLFTATPSFMPMQPANYMSPDDMLRAYAERRVASPPVGGNMPVPPAASYGGAMRTLYSPTTPTSSAPFMMSMHDNRKSIAPTMASGISTFAEEDVYGGTA